MTFYKDEYKLENYLVSPLDYIVSKKVKVVYQVLAKTRREGPCQGGEYFRKAGALRTSPFTEHVL